MYLADLNKRISDNKLSFIIGLNGIILFLERILIILTVPIENSLNIVCLLGIMIVAVSMKHY